MVVRYVTHEDFTLSLSHLSLLLISHIIFSFDIFFVTLPQLVSLPPLFLLLASCSFSLLLPLFFLLSSSSYSLPSLPLCAPFPSTHQSLALASPLRTYGMMDRRASGASKAKGHLPGAQCCQGALGLALQPRPHTSVSRHSHIQHAHSNTYYRIGYLTLATVTLLLTKSRVLFV